MATLFPFNQLPKVPNLILEQFVPLLMEQQSKLTELADSLITDNDNLLPNVSCDDAQISEIKNKLQEAQQLIRVAQMAQVTAPRQTAKSTNDDLWGVE